MNPSRETVERWNRVLAPYFGPDTKRSVTQLVLTALAFVGLWAAMFWSLQVGYWLTLLLSIPTAGFLMRLFMIQHDCGHGSFLKSQKAADRIGFAIGVLVLTPYQYWRKTHAIHHAHSGDLDFRGFGDIETLTVREYRALSPFRKLGYRLYRSPIVLFGIGAAFHFIVKHRFPWDIPRTWKREWGSVWLTNLALAAIIVTMSLTLGLQRFLMVQVPLTLVSCSMGVWLFYVQHQFDETYWQRHEEWNYFEAGLRGSSYLTLPKPLQWLTAHIGLHHVHHLSARIPNYRLAKCHRENPELQAVTRMSLWKGIKSMVLTLWDEDNRRLISFRQFRRMLRIQRTAESTATG